MRETQPDQDDEIQAFHRWISASTTRRSGVGGSSHATQCDFIPPSAVREYLAAGRRVEDLLTSLFGREASRGIDADGVREHYLRPLAILLAIGQGPMIKHFVQYRSLQDHRLPYRTPPQDFPFSSDPEFFQRFHNQQWQFCAADLEYNMNLHLHQEEILPITYKEEIGHGGNGIIYKIVVDEEYNKLVPQRWKMPERPPGLRNTFVLKTYRGPDAKEQHKAEHDAFMNLRYDNRPIAFVIAYYGSFVDEDTYNIILEYADRGNLEEFMKTTPEPSTGESMIELWERLTRISYGLAHIHGTPATTSAGAPLLGWHQDIKPANILVFSGSGASSHDVYFKLADLSRCHFKHGRSLQSGDSDLDAFGTRAYGAPETYRPDEATDSFHVQVRSEVDVWSLGCVFSEAAVWSCYGWNQVLEYRYRRQEEVKRTLGGDGEHLFHDGHDVLKTVQDIHEQIIGSPRSIDHVIVEVLRFLNDNMLLTEDEPRSTAQQVYHRSKSIINKIREKHSVPATKAPYRKDEEAKSVNDPEERPMTPPSVPPGYVSGFAASSHKPIGTRVGTSSSVRPMSMISNTSHSSDLQHTLANRRYHSRERYDNRQNHQHENQFGPFQSDSMSLHNLPDPPSPAISYQSSNIDRFNALSLNTQDLDSREHRRLHRETMGETSRSGSVAPDKASLRRNKTEENNSSHPGRYSSESFPNPISKPPSPTSDPKLPTLPPSSFSNHHDSQPSMNVEHKSSPSSKYQQREDALERPYLSLTEGLEWKQNTKKGLLCSLPGQENLTYLDERDHIILIDNTKSMREHRKDILTLVQLLFYMLKHSDDTGLDVFFTQSKQKVNSGRSSKLVTAVGEAAFQGISDMRSRLSHIIQEHKSRFGTQTPPSKSWYKRSGPLQAQKPLSFYVLTDGKYQPNEVGPVITSLVDSMRANHIPKEHVGIQFIRFGEDAQGIARLVHLDRGLGLKDIDMDIVDTTFWNGNIWKQLLGAINSWYDDDPD